MHVPTTGNRRGWRLPSVHDLASLVHPSVASPGPTLQPGHPFTNVQSFSYRSATMDALYPDNARQVSFFNGIESINDKPTSNHVWCVRGGMQADAY